MGHPRLFSPHFFFQSAVVRIVGVAAEVMQLKADNGNRSLLLVHSPVAVMLIGSISCLRRRMEPHGYLSQVSSGRHLQGKLSVSVLLWYYYADCQSIFRILEWVWSGSGLVACFTCDRGSVRKSPAAVQVLTSIQVPDRCRLVILSSFLLQQYLMKHSLLRVCSLQAIQGIFSSSGNAEAWHNPSYWHGKVTEIFVCDSDHRFRFITQILH